MYIVKKVPPDGKVFCVTLQEIQNRLQFLLQQENLSHFSVTTLERPLSFEYYLEWLQKEYHGEMNYLKEHAPIKEDPRIKWPRAHSALIFAIPYFPHPQPNETTHPLKSARLSLYAQGDDYHHWFKEKLQKICQFLSDQFPQEEFLAFTDSSPVLERDLAVKAGLGWVGKNTCVIHPQKGSLFFIGEIYTSLKFESEFEPLPDFCGKCQKCLQSCPTGALLEAHILDARKCISYLTIESRQLPPEELREKIGDWFFGCDICQTVCPWNEKIFKGKLNSESMLSLTPEKEIELEEDLKYILSSSGKKLERDFFGTPLSRAGSFGLKRNALVIIGNRKLKKLRPQVETFLSHEKLRELAEWTLKKLET